MMKLLLSTPSEGSRAEKRAVTDDALQKIQPILKESETASAHVEHIVLDVSEATLQEIQALLPDSSIFNDGRAADPKAPRFTAASADTSES